jgi:hypothetical protein
LNCSKSIAAKATADRKKLKNIILKEKIEKDFSKCPKIAAKCAAPILLAAPLYIAPAVESSDTGFCLDKTSWISVAIFSMGFLGSG